MSEKWQKNIDRFFRSAERTGEQFKITRAIEIIKTVEQEQSLENSAALVSAFANNQAFGSKRAGGKGAQARARTYELKYAGVRERADAIRERHPDWGNLAIARQLKCEVNLENVRDEVDRFIYEKSLDRLRKLVARENS